MDSIKRIQVITPLYENPRFLYLMDFLNKHPVFYNVNWQITDENPDFVIAYTPEKSETNSDIAIHYNASFFTHSNLVSKEWKISSFYFHNRLLHGVVTSEDPGTNFFINDVIRLDLFNTIFFMISRYEEVFANPQQNSQAGWLSEKNHLLVKANIMDIPVVDRLCKALAEIIDSNLIGQRSNPTTYGISHDIDIIYRFKPFSKFIKSVAATLWYARGLKHLKNILYHYVKMVQGKEKDPYDTFHWLLSNEEIWKEKFLFLMAGGNSRFDNKYNVGDQFVNEIIKASRKKNYHIGIHPSYNAHIDEKMFRQEVNTLEQKLAEKIKLNRQHWLRWDWKTTPYIMEKQGLKCDSSMGYNQHLGFRCGTGYPYRMYDFKNERAFSFIEYPFAYMESAAIHYCRNNKKEIISTSEAFVKKNKYNTHILFNFHNSNFDPTTIYGQKLTDFYRNKLIPLLEG